MGRTIDIDIAIQRQLAPREYQELVSDLQHAVRAFDVLGHVAPTLLRDLVRFECRRAHGGSLGAAHAAIEDLIAELREHRTKVVVTGRAPLSLIRGGRR
jgi:hypothetical protein